MYHIESIIQTDLKLLLHTTTDTVSNNVSSYDTAAKLAEAVDLIVEFNGLEEWEIYEILYYSEIDD